MIKKTLFLLLFAVLFSVRTNAGMEQTERCLARIRELENDIEKLNSKKSSLEDFVKNPPPLIPPFLLKSKKAKIAELEDKIKKEKEKRENEHGRLKKYERIIITKISIRADGSWDDNGDPDIHIRDGNGSTIVRGEDDTVFLEKALHENATNYDYLEVFDYDTGMFRGDDDYMGTIPLEKYKIRDGVAKDTDVVSINGSSTSNGGTIHYTVEYRVEY